MFASGPDRIDFKNKDVWTVANAPAIALAFGYVLTDRFRAVLGEFVDSQVSTARITNYLEIIARRSFSSVKPPLEKLPKKGR